MKAFLILWVCLIAVSCSAPILRTEYQIENYGDLLVTNSPTYRFKPNPDKVNGGVEFNYSILIRNISSTQKYILRTNQAVFAVRDEVIPIKCALTNQKEAAEYLLENSDIVRLDCKVVIDKAHVQNLKNKDTSGELSLPYSGYENSKSMNFKYKLVLEDFE